MLFGKSQAIENEFPRISRARMLNTIDPESSEVGDGTTSAPTEEEKRWFEIMKSTVPELEKIRKKINPYNREHNMFLRNFFKGTAELVLDNNNRMLVPRRLMDLIGAGRDVVLAGQDGRIEIWPASVYETIGMPSEDFADLAEKLLGGSTNEPLD